MNARHRIGATVAAFAVAWGGVSIAAPVASAQAFHCDDARHITGSAGHRGATIRCTGAPEFTAKIDCRMDNGHLYEVFGNPVRDGQVSVAWCGLGAHVAHTTGVPL